MHFQLNKFNELPLEMLYQIMQLRANVFVVEQQCVFLDPDGLDLSCFHLLGYKTSENKSLQAYARIVPPQVKYEEVSFGRVAVVSEARKKGWGKKLIAETLNIIKKSFPQNGIRISAQCYLEKFYYAFGFEKVSEPYLEDGIWHIEMLSGRTKKERH